MKDQQLGLLLSISTSQLVIPGKQYGKQGGMMNLLEFQINENELFEDLSNTPAIAPSGALYQIYFIFPHRFRIDDTDLFETTQGLPVIVGGQNNEHVLNNQSVRNVWMNIPLIHLALIGKEAVAKACSGQEAFYDLQGSGAQLQFFPENEFVRVRFTLNGREARIGCEDLFQVFSIYAENVSKFLLKRVPDMEHHPIRGRIMDSR